MDGPNSATSFGGFGRNVQVSAAGGPAPTLFRAQALPSFRDSPTGYLRSFYEPRSRRTHLLGPYHIVDIVGVTSSILVTPTIQVSKGLTGNRKPFFNSPNFHCTRRPTQATEAETGTLNGGDSASLSKALGFSEALSRVLHVRLLRDTYLAIDHGCTGIG